MTSTDLLVRTSRISRNRPTSGHYLRVVINRKPGDSCSWHIDGGSERRVIPATLNYYVAHHTLVDFFSKTEKITQKKVTVPEHGDSQDFAELRGYSFHWHVFGLFLRFRFNL